MNAQAKWKWATNSAERNALVLTATGDYRLDGIPLAFGGDPAGTARAALEAINARRAALGLDPIAVTNTTLSLHP